MTNYRVTVDLVCPSNWTMADVRRYIETKITSVDSEKNSIIIEDLDREDCCA